MTNLEKYMNKIVNIRNQDSTEVVVAMDIGTGILRRCSDVGCERCKFSSRFNGNGRCEVNLVRWLFSEYQEPAPKLTKTERGFCEIVETGYIARDLANNSISYYSAKPYIDSHNYFWNSQYTSIELSPEYFSFIKWEDKKPWSIEDLLKLEVEE